MKITLPFDLGRKSIPLELPGHATIVMPEEFPSRQKSEIESKILSNLEKSLPPRGESVAFIVDDVTRPTPVGEFAPAVLDLLKKRFERVVVVMAPGSHNFRDDDIYSRIPPEHLEGIEHTIHNAFDEKDMTFTGISSAGTPLWFNSAVMNCRYKIGMGSVFPSEIAGYTGAGKIMMPGVAYYLSININHLRYFSPMA